MCAIESKVEKKNHVVKYYPNFISMKNSTCIFILPRKQDKTFA